MPKNFYINKLGLVITSSHAKYFSSNTAGMINFTLWFMQPYPVAGLEITHWLMLCRWEADNWKHHPLLCHHTTAFQLPDVHLLRHVQFMGPDATQSYDILYSSSSISTTDTQRCETRLFLNLSLSAHLLPLCLSLAGNDGSFDVEAAAVHRACLTRLLSQEFYPPSPWGLHCFSPITRAEADSEWGEKRKKTVRLKERGRGREGVLGEKEVRRRIIFYCSETESVNAWRSAVRFWWEVDEGCVTRNIHIGSF